MTSNFSVDIQQSHDSNGLKEAQVAVVMVPLPAQGHLNQLLQFSRIISSYNIPVYYVGSATHNRQAKLRVHGLDPLLDAKIHFRDFPTPDFVCPPSDTSSQFPAHMQSVMMETTKLREPVAEFLRELSSTARRVVVVHDCLMTAVIQDVASIPNAESYIFHCVSAFTNFTNAWDAAGRPVLEDAEIPDGTPPIFTSFSLEFLNFIGYQIGCQKINCGTLYNTSRAIEGAHLDLVAKLENIQGIRYWAIGPVNPITISHNQNSKSRHKCLEWLDKQAPKSVLLVSFGTLTSLTDEQIGELAIGLEQSEQKFIWVLRDADKGDIFSGEVGIIQLPQGYEERIEAAGVGVVVRDWAPQVEILGHPSTGGFMSHCGWNSCLESITMGVPIAAWPMHSGQPRNTILITQVLKVGLAVKEEESQDVVASSTIEKVVRRLMASEEGDETRKRAAELGGILKRSLDEGGVSRMELDSFIAHISR